jgi:hypothetical protein
MRPFAEVCLTEAGWIDEKGTIQPTKPRKRLPQIQAAVEADKLESR